jgi:phosphoribosylanthranilate isomerase
MYMKTKIKICGLTRIEDIEAVNVAKPDYVGFVFAESRRKVSPAQANVLRGALRPEIIPVGVFVNETIENILLLVRENIIQAVQLHGAEDGNYIKELKSKTNIPIIKAVSVQKEGDAQAWENCAADFLLLDHKSGGTGETFNWNLIGKVTKPFFLAGGLSSENIADAIQMVKPFAVDTSSGVETSPGIKCAEKIRDFIWAVQAV